MAGEESLTRFMDEQTSTADGGAALHTVQGYAQGSGLPYLVPLICCSVPWSALHTTPG